MRSVHTAYLHHTATLRTATFKEIEAIHLARGFAGIGYHILIDGEPRIHMGRDLNKIGAHTKYHNTGSIGIAVTGDNTREDRLWIPEQLDLLEDAFWFVRGIWPGIEFKLHSNARPTLCPSFALYPFLKERGFIPCG